MFLAINGSSDRTKVKTDQNKFNQNKDGHVDSIDSSLLGSGKSDNRKPKDSSFNIRQNNGRSSLSNSSSSSSSSSNRPSSFKSRHDDKQSSIPREPKKHRDLEQGNNHNRHRSPLHSRPSDNSRSHQRNRNARPRSPRPQRSPKPSRSPKHPSENPAETSKNTFSIKHASLPPIVVLTNLAPGTTSDDVRVCCHFFLLLLLLLNHNFTNYF